MSKECYVPKRFRNKALALIDIADTIISEYFEMGYDLTLRQLYYQFVARDVLENCQRSYDNLGKLVNDARLAGHIDWDRIKDRTRSHRGNQHWDSPEQILRSAADSYMLDKWAVQEWHVEVWVEKDALIDVVQRCAGELDVTCFSCRGYVSQSAMYAAAKRMLYHEARGRRTIIFHLGDHDPSGLDMTRDIQERLDLFGSLCVVDRIALNMDQIKQYQPPPNPCKITDSRAGAYISKYGSKSWELDALSPEVLHELITKHVLELRDEKLWKKESKREERGRAYIVDVSDKYNAGQK